MTGVAGKGSKGVIRVTSSSLMTASHLHIELGEARRGRMRLKERDENRE